MTPPPVEADNTVNRSQRIYLASSWRNQVQPRLVRVLRAAGFEVYDFKRPHGDDRAGFSWDHSGLVDHNQPVDAVPQAAYLEAINHPASAAGYQRDMDAMERADTFVLVLPCGRSAHLELGWAVGQGKRTAVLLDNPCTPELMYRMVDYLAPNEMALLDWLRVGTWEVPIRRAKVAYPEVMLFDMKRIAVRESTTVFEIVRTALAAALIDPDRLSAAAARTQPRSSGEVREGTWDLDAAQHEALILIAVAKGVTVDALVRAALIQSHPDLRT